MDFFLNKKALDFLEFLTNFFKVKFSSYCDWNIFLDIKSGWKRCLLLHNLIERPKNYANKAIFVQ